MLKSQEGQRVPNVTFHTRDGGDWADVTSRDVFAGKTVVCFIEPEKDGDPFEVSDADTMLRYLNPKAAAPRNVTLFTKDGCPHCARAKAMLADRGMTYEEIAVGAEVTTRSLRAVTGADTVPQVFIDGERIGGADALATYLSAA